ncbi:hypothetical protein Hokovirus_1_294 [Hokovirus HKV1]|uniref:Uncharacterized protein n=1 Tax=Hokovirus HKV1 TaxID=1977638 RepID=A0A1V0SFC1_9VIRU|nr:hypothetical protein Hokovirus_1_294 [Hokovirus HKV1]
MEFTILKVKQVLQDGKYIFQDLENIDLCYNIHDEILDNYDLIMVLYPHIFLKIPNKRRLLSPDEDIPIDIFSKYNFYSLGYNSKLNRVTLSIDNKKWRLVRNNFIEYKNIDNIKNLLPFYVLTYQKHNIPEQDMDTLRCFFDITKMNNLKLDNLGRDIYLFEKRETLTKAASRG